MRRPVALLLALVVVGSACERRGSGERPRLAVSGQSAEAATRLASATGRASASPDSASNADEGAWVAALRAGRYADAAQALDAVSDLDKQPGLRLARARAALELGDARRALELLAGLEKDLPALAPHIEELRADAALGSGAYADAAKYFEGQSGLESQVSAAAAREQTGELDRAIALCTRVIRALGGKRQRSLESRARDLRARVAARAGKKEQAAQDLRWLALEDPVGSQEADTRLAALVPSKALDKEERLGRALALGRAGERLRVEAELERLDKAPGPALSRARIERARAFGLYYSRADYRRASELFTRASKGPGVDAAECAFYAARSLARAQDDAAAVRAYKNVATRFAKSPFAEQATYLLARTHYAGGAFAEAIKAYDSYLSRYGLRARSRVDSLYERAVASLAVGRPAAAASTFASLARRERDD